MVSSKSNEWATPQDLFEELNAEFKFTLDPCSTDENCKCEKHYTLLDDCLSKSWSGDVVFMNPPYGGNTGAWIKKALEESKSGCTVACLIVAAIDRSYWHDYIFPYAAQIRFVRGRLKFCGSSSTAPFASAIIIFTDKIRYKDKYRYNYKPALVT
jgi:site-specific DNA-methyltransferase (adenine-specific)